MDWTKIILAVIAAISALIAGGVIIRMNSSKKSHKSDKSFRVSQKNIDAGGDVVGRDKITRK